MYIDIVTRSRSPPTPLQTENNPAHCIATPKVKLQPEDGPHAGPKHVVVSPMY